MTRMKTFSTKPGQVKERPGLSITMYSVKTFDIQLKVSPLDFDIELPSLYLFNRDI